MPRVAELFYSLQGEGARAGEPSVFIRLSGCSAKYACAAAGIVCDTEFESGTEMTVDALLTQVRALSDRCNWIVWTGGEPTDQLDADLVATFTAAGYHQQIETSGVRPVPPGLEFITVSPKVAEHILVRHFPVRLDRTHVDELKYVRHHGQPIPQPSLTARNYCLSPHSDGNQINRVNLQHCIDLCLAHPEWRLSLQQHKLWRMR